jgi:ferredoxin
LYLMLCLLAFHHFKKTHTGVNIAKAILHLLDWADVTLKVCISCDNYSHVCPTLSLSFVDWPLYA